MFIALSAGFLIKPFSDIYSILFRRSLVLSYYYNSSVKKTKISLEK
jgi:hypothetical protein